jgi:hypothetical protein
MFAMTVLIMLAYLNLGRIRLSLIKSKKVKMDYFKTYIPDSDYPRELYTSSRLLSNLYEAPIKFYVINLIVMSLGINSILFMTLSCAYVFLRYIHAYILAMGKSVSMRFYFFCASQALLGLMWLICLIEIL